jgi:membrane-bound metal-dependent hydrolase YbcI (DUF457 family)
MQVYRAATALIFRPAVESHVFVGHALLGFTLVALLARRRGWSAERALSLGVVGGIFAAVPDVDMAYALLGVAGVGVADAFTVAQAFWATGNLVHRSITHSLVLAVPVALAVGFWVAGDRRVAAGTTGTARRRGATARLAALVLVGLVVAVVAGESGPVGAAVTVLFVCCALFVAAQVARRTDLPTLAVTAAATVGLLTHPFGDLFTGRPPELLYPVEVTLVTERVTLAADPTLHLLSAFGLELATGWVALLVWSRLTGVSLRPLLRPWAGLAAGYGVLVVALPAPTLDLSYPFVFTVLAVGALGALPRLGAPAGTDETGSFAAANPVERRFPRVRRVRPPDRAGAVVTGLAAVTLAWLAYGAAYLAWPT